jgi:hypothetical protein
VDQAGLIRLYLEAAATLAEPRYVDVARGALDHARRRLLDAEGRVLASVAAAPASRRGRRAARRSPPVRRRRRGDDHRRVRGARRRVPGVDIAVHRELFASTADGEVPHDLAPWPRGRAHRRPAR